MEQDTLYLPITKKYTGFRFLPAYTLNKKLLKISWYVGRQSSIWTNTKCMSWELAMLLFLCQQPTLPLTCKLNFERYPALLFKDFSGS